MGEKKEKPSMKSRRRATLNIARTAAREHDLDGFTWALLEHWIDCLKQDIESPINGQNVAAILNTLHRKVTPVEKKEEEEEKVSELQLWLNQSVPGDGKKTL